MKYIKRFSRWILRDEIKEHKDLSFRLATRLEQYLPDLNPDGETDNTHIFNLHVDVCRGLNKDFYIPSGNYKMATKINFKWSS